MARKQRAGGATAAEKAAAVSEALLFTTVCMVGLPVEAQVKDGSLYSGVFHTASLRDGYGIVLKKARKIAHGKCDTNVAVGALIDTLVMLSSDLVQIVVKEFALPAEGIAGNVAGDSVKAATRTIEPQGCSRDLEGELNSVDEAPLESCHMLVPGNCHLDSLISIILCNQHLPLFIQILKHWWIIFH